MTKYALPAYAFREQKRYMRGHLVKPRSMKLHSFIRRFQELNAYLADFPPDTEGQENVPLHTDEIMDIIYHSVPTSWKNKMIGQNFNYANSTIIEMTDFFDGRVENLEPKEEKKEPLAAVKKSKDRKSSKKSKQKDSNSSVVESSVESSVEHRPIKKYCTLHGKSS